MSSPPSCPRPGRRPSLVTLGIVGLVLILLAALAWREIPVGRAVRTYTALIAAANRGDVAGARALCSRRYLESHDLRPAEEGGLVGLPRNIHRRFQAWRHGAHVWLCPTNTIGPVYQFIHEDGGWRFDGPVGVLAGGNRFLPLRDAPEGVELDAPRRRPAGTPSR